MLENKPEPYQLSKKQLRNLQNMYDQSDIALYFQSLPPVQPTCNRTSKHFADKIVTGLDVLFNLGVLQISKQKKKVDELMDEVKINAEVLKAEELKAKKQFIQQQLDYLKHQTSITRSNSEDRILQNKLVLSKQDHKKIVRKLKKDRSVRDRKHNQLLQSLQRTVKQAQQLQKKKLQQQKEQQLRLRREAIEQHLQKNKKEHDQFLQIERESIQKLKSIKNNKFMYQKIQQKYNKSVVLPILQQKQKKLKEIREYRSLNISDIKQHQKSYMEQKDYQQTKRSQIKNQWTYRPPPRSSRLEIILQEERLQKIQMLQDKKKKLQDKIQRQQNFLLHLKQNFVPTIDPVKEQQLKQRIQKSRIIKPQGGNIKQLGLNYLQQAKKRRKIITKIQERPQTQRNKTNGTHTSINQNQKQQKTKSITDYHTISHSRDEHYEHIRRRKLQKIAKQQDMPQADRINQLKKQAEKISQRMGRKQKQLKFKKDDKIKQDTLQLLLSSIQAKIGIIQMYQ